MHRLPVKGQLCVLSDNCPDRHTLLRRIVPFGTILGGQRELNRIKDRNKCLVAEHPGAVGKLFDHPAGWIFLCQLLRHAADWFA